MGHPYPHIFKWSDRWMNFWEELRPGKRFDLDAHLLRNRIQPHKGRANLLSSWAMCANLYFPFGQDAGGLRLLQSFLREHVHPEIADVTKVELEYAAPPKTDLHPAKLLWEKDGDRGSHKTSPDVAFIVTLLDGRPGIVLTEVKFTEHHFYPCSARKMLDAQQRKVCDDPGKVAASWCSLCHQHAEDPRL